MSNKIKKTEAEWQAELNAQQYYVCRQQGTEPAFSGQYYDCKTPGIYQCVCCGTELFKSDAKFDSGTGWPSFWEAMNSEAVETHEDISHGMRRIEVLCRKCGAHLGHVFPDGPKPTGLRYCINSAALNLKPSESL